MNCPESRGSQHAARPNPNKNKCREQQPVRTEAPSTQSCETNPRLRAELTLITCFASRADRLAICLLLPRRLVPLALLLSASLSPSPSLTAPPPSSASTSTTAPSSSSSSSRFNARKSKLDGGECASSGAPAPAPARATRARLRAGVGPCGGAGLRFGLGAGLKSGCGRRAQAQEHIAGAWSRLIEWAPGRLGRSGPSGDDNKMGQGKRVRVPRRETEFCAALSSGTHESDSR